MFIFNVSSLPLLFFVSEILGRFSPKLSLGSLGMRGILVEIVRIQCSGSHLWVAMKGTHHWWMYIVVCWHLLFFFQWFTGDLTQCFGPYQSIDIMPRRMFRATGSTGQRVHPQNLLQQLRQATSLKFLQDYTDSTWRQTQRSWPNPGVRRGRLTYLWMPSVHVRMNPSARRFLRASWRCCRRLQRRRRRLQFCKPKTGSSTAAGSKFKDFLQVEGFSKELPTSPFWSKSVRDTWEAGSTAQRPWSKCPRPTRMDPGLELWETPSRPVPQAQKKENSAKKIANCVDWIITGYPWASVAWSWCQNHSRTESN